MKYQHPINEVALGSVFAIFFYYFIFFAFLYLHLFGVTTKFQMVNIPLSISIRDTFSFRIRPPFRAKQTKQKIEKIKIMGHATAHAHSSSSSSALKSTERAKSAPLVITPCRT